MGKPPALSELPEFASEYVGKVKLATSTRRSTPSRRWTHWLVEAKMNKEMESLDVKGKELAALRWADYVTIETDAPWRYLLVSEDDVATASGSWSALKQLGIH